MLKLEGNSDACEGFGFTTLLYLNFYTKHIQTVEQFILPFGVKSSANRAKPDTLPTESWSL